MLTIKLKRIGKKNQASFRIVVMEKRSKLNGRYLEDLGWLNRARDEFQINKARVEHWLKNGAQPTDTIHNLLVKSGVISGPKRPKHKKKKVEKEKQ
jgi:small subunit ribosomal protein S16